MMIALGASILDSKYVQFLDQTGALKQPVVSNISYDQNLTAPSLSSTQLHLAGLLRRTKIMPPSMDEGRVRRFGCG